MSEMSQAEFARVVGVARQRVGQGIRDGRLKKSLGRDHRGVVFIADLELAKVEWEENADTGKRGDPAADDPSVTGASARLKKWQADLAELKFKEASGELLPVAEVRREWLDILSSVRSRVLAIPSRLKQQIPHLTLAEIALIERIVRETLESAAQAQQ